jgi:hypothetical protein
MLRIFYRSPAPSIARQPVSILPVVEQEDTARRLCEIGIKTDDVAGRIETTTQAASSGTPDHPVSAAFPDAEHARGV